MGRYILSLPIALLVPTPSRKYLGIFNNRLGTNKVLSVVCHTHCSFYVRPDLNKNLSPLKEEIPI